MIMNSGPVLPISATHDPGDYIKHSLSGAWLIHRGFKPLKLELKCNQMYSLPVPGARNYVTNLYLTEYKTRIRNYTIFWYKAFKIATNSAGVSKVYWYPGQYSKIEEVNSLIKQTKNG
jgi:hypothetical protein